MMARKPREAPPADAARSTPPATVTADPEPSTLLAAAIFFGLALLYFVPVFMPGRAIYGSDYLQGGYPFLEFVRDRLREGHLPMWVPHVYGGVPLFASAGNAFYPVWIALSQMMPIHVAFAAVFVVQFGLAGLGMWLLLRELEVRRWIALVAGLSFQFTGIVTSAVHAGHDGRVIVASLAPLFLFFIHRIVRTGSLGAAIGAAATLGLTLLSFQIQSNYYLLLTGLAWAVFALVAFRVRGIDLVRRLALGLGSVAFAFMLASVNFLPFMNYVQFSPRGDAAGRDYAFATSWSMEIGDLSAIAIPEIVGASILEPTTKEPLTTPYRGGLPFKLHTEYVGALALVLLVFGAWTNRRDRYWLFFLGLAFVTLTMSLGGNTPLYRLYYELLPGVKRFRAPSISYFLLPLSLCIMAGLTLERLARMRAGVAERAALRPAGRADAGRPDGIQAGRARPAGSRSAAGRQDARAQGARPPAGARVPVERARSLAMELLGGGAVLILIGAIGTAIGDTGRMAGVVRFALAFTAVSAVLWMWLGNRLSATLAAALLAVVTTVDLSIVGQRFLSTVEPPAEYYPADDVITALRDTAAVSPRVWVMPVARDGYRSGNHLMLFDIDQATGEHPAPLYRWNQLLGVNEAGALDWSNVATPGGAFRAANIGRMVLRTDLSGLDNYERMRLVHSGPAGRVYQDPEMLPRAYLVSAARIVPDSATLAAVTDTAWDPAQAVVLSEDPGIALTGRAVNGTARITRYTPDDVSVMVSTQAPAILVLSDNYYPEWRAEMDGADVPIMRANHAFRAVAVPAGDHEIRFTMHSERLLIGFSLYVAGWITLALAAAVLGTRRFLHARRERARNGIDGMEVHADDAAPVPG